MSRSRASVAGGYVRKTVSIPADTMTRIEGFLEENPGMTLSLFLTNAAESMFKPRKGMLPHPGIAASEYREKGKD